MSNYSILLTVDVEDWFQVENLRPSCPVSSWPSCELRVEHNTHKLLDLFDEIGDQRSTVGGQPFAVKDKSSESRQKGDVGNDDGQQTTDNGQDEKVRGTFFVLGWIAERVPNLVREIRARGHEVASHGYGHELCRQCSTDDLREELGNSKKLLEDIIGDRVYGYRAPSFSISDEILKLIEVTGYEYDSSYNSFAMHGRYGRISLNGHERRGIAYEIFDGFYELPISNLPLLAFVGSSILAEGPEASRRTHFRHLRHFFLPWGGGAYFRLIPGLVFRMGVREILRRQQGYLFYMHPWEVDPEQPRPEGTTAFSRFKHYTNLSRTEGKLRSLLKNFSECSFVSCHNYLQQYNPTSSTRKSSLTGRLQNKLKLDILEKTLM